MAIVNKVLRVKVLMRYYSIRSAILVIKVLLQQFNVKMYYAVLMHKYSFCILVPDSIR